MSVEVGSRDDVFTIEPGTYMRKFALAVAMAAVAWALAIAIIAATWSPMSVLALLIGLVPGIVAFGMAESARNMRGREITVDVDKKELVICDPEAKPRTIYLHQLRSVTLDKRSRLNISQTLKLLMMDGKTHSLTGVARAKRLKARLNEVRVDNFKTLYYTKK